MSYEDCYAAMHLQMPGVVPRTEYSIEMHTPLLRKISGLDLIDDSPAALRRQAVEMLHRQWDMSFAWSIDMNTQYFGDCCTSMGHAEYDEHGKDRRDDVHCPFTDPEQVLSFDPAAHYALPAQPQLIQSLNEAYRARVKNNPDMVNMVGTYTTLMSAMIAIFGWDMLLTAAGEDYDRFGATLQRYSDWLYPFYTAMAECESPNIMIHDDMVWTSGAFLPPAWYRKYLFPLLKRYIQPLKEAGKKVTFTSDGNFTVFIDDLADCGVDGFVMEPTTDMAYIAQKYGKTHYFIGNADTRILLLGTKEEIEAEVQRCLDIGKSCPGFIMAVGNHIPPNTPLESCLWYNDYFMKHRKR